MEITPKELRDVALRLIENMPAVLSRAQDGLDLDLKLMLDDMGGWSVPDVLRTAATCALVKRLPSDHPDVQFVLDALENYGYGAPR